MAFKFVAFFALLAMVNAGGYITPVTYAAAPVVTKIANPSVDAVATTQHNVVRSFGGTVSSYSKAVDTPYSSVRKTDTRINNNVYTPAVAKTVTYTAPAVTKAVYGAHVPTVYAAPAVAKTLYAAPTVAHAPAVYAAHAPTVYAAAPAVTKTVYAAPTVAHAPAVYAAPTAYTHAAPATYSHASPVVYSHAAPGVAKTVTYAAPAVTTSFNHGPAATTYTHNSPGVSSYGSSQTVHYSPAEMVSHMSFDGFGTHWGF